ncbi:hypothetical protein K5N30_002757 [Vibrio parahaemolyticus]|nr:hypothetical protein [Vibrio parahaemolyticus]
MNKPSIDSRPLGADWLCQTEDGNWWWKFDEPENHDEFSSVEYVGDE